MGITLDQLVYDATDGGAEVGSHVKAGTDGTAIGHVGDALKVDIGSVADLDIRDLAFATDKVDVSGSEVSLDAATLAALETITVTATDLDIRDLTHVSDSVKVGDGTDFLAVNADGSLNVNLTDDGIADDAADSGNPFKVGSRAFDGALTAVSASNDRADMLSDMYRRIWMNNAPNVASKSSTASIGTSAAELAATPLAGRTRILIQNNGAKDLYVGHDNSVTTANGIRIPKGASYEMPYGEDLNVWAISSAAAQDVRIFETA